MKSTLKGTASLAAALAIIGCAEPPPIQITPENNPFLEDRQGTTFDTYFSDYAQLDKRYGGEHFYFAGGVKYGSLGAWVTNGWWSDNYRPVSAGAEGGHVSWAGFPPESFKLLKGCSSHDIVVLTGYGSDDDPWRVRLKPLKILFEVGGATYDVTSDLQNCGEEYGHHYAINNVYDQDYVLKTWVEVVAFENGVAKPWTLANGGTPKIIYWEHRLLKPALVQNPCWPGSDDTRMAIRQDEAYWDGWQEQRVKGATGQSSRGWYHGAGTIYNPQVHDNQQVIISNQPAPVPGKFVFAGDTTVYAPTGLDTRYATMQTIGKGEGMVWTKEDYLSEVPAGSGNMVSENFDFAWRTVTKTAGGALDCDPQNPLRCKCAPPEQGCSASEYTCYRLPSEGATSEKCMIHYTTSPYTSCMGRRWEW